jgi:hypothetical protein
MSIENMSAENRNNIPMQRCCSFCRRPGHIITNCNDERLLQFETQCLNIISNDLSQEILRQFILEYSLHSPNVVRSFAHKKLGLNHRNNIDVCIDRIIQYFSNLNRNYELHDEPNNTEAQQHADLINDTSLLSSVLYLGHRRNIARIEVTELFIFMQILEQLGLLSREPEQLLNTSKKFNIETKITDKNNVNLTEICECNICYESHKKTQFIKLNCSHEFCKECFKNCLKNERKNNPSCAFCRDEINQIELREESIKDELSEYLIN